MQILDNYQMNEIDSIALPGEVFYKSGSQVILFPVYILDQENTPKAMSEILMAQKRHPSSSSLTLVATFILYW